MSSGDIDKSDLIERLLKSRLDESSQAQPDLNDPSLTNFTPEEMELLKNIYMSNQNMQKGESAKNYKAFMPEPGFCLKTKNSRDEKVFINICKSNEINEPRDISEEELLKLIEMNDLENAAFQFRVPMSLGEPHPELDHAGCASVCYDVCINSNFFKKVNENSTFMGFLMSIVIDGLENKYSIKIDRNCKMLKNKKFMGKVNEQYIRTTPKPLIAEVNNDSTAKSRPEPIESQKQPQEDTKHEIPKYKIIKETDESDPEKVSFLVAEIELPKILSAKSLQLDIGEDRIKLTTRSGLYFLDIYLPYNLIQEDCGAQFDRKTKILTITMPVNAIAPSDTTH